MPRPSIPRLVFSNRQRRVRFSLARLQSFACGALPLVWRKRRRHAEIELVREISIILVSDDTMRKLHRRFCQIDNATDVLTFQHGEIVISVDTARRQARAFSMTVAAELRLYLLHGLLHLAGFEDGNAPARARMESVQEEILGQLTFTCD